MAETYEDGNVCDRWDRIMHQLSAQPRRQIIVSLLDAPVERRLMLPEAALSSMSSRDPEKLTIELKHHHLPLLASAGYVRWEQDRFCVQRGPHFEVLAGVVRLLDSPDQLPKPLANGGFVESHDGQ